MGAFLVLGGSGFIGTHVVGHLVRQEADVVVVSRRAPDARAEPAARYETVDASRGFDRLESLVAALRPSHVLNLMGGRRAGALEHAAVSFRLARFLAERHPATRLILAGSAAEYGRPTALPVEETHPLRPVTEYGLAKAAQSWMARAIHDETGLPVLVARIFNVIGPGQGRAFVLGSAVAQALDLATGARARIRLGNVEATRDFIDVRDVARALALLATGGLAGEAYNICSGRPTPIRDALRVIGALCDVPAEVFEASTRPTREDVPVIFGSYAKVEQHTGWSPTVDISSTLRDMVIHERSTRAGATAPRTPIPHARGPQ